MIRRLARFLAGLAWLLPGFLLWASFPPMGEKLDSLFAIAPLIWLARRGDAAKSARVWFKNGVLFWVATMTWMPAIVKNGGPWPLVVLGWFALSLYCALYFGAFGWLSANVWRWSRIGGYGRRLFAILFAEPLLWAGLEIVRSRLLGGFAWNQLGVPSVCAGFGAPAAFGGVYLVSALVILVNGTFASIAERMLGQLMGGCVDDIRIPKWLRSIETLLPFAIVYVFFHLPASSQKPGDSGQTTLSVALVQRDFPCVFERDREENPVAVYEKLFANVSVLRPDLVVLPESALSEFGPIGSVRVGQFLDFAISHTGARAILAGGGRRADGKEYNSAILHLPQSAGAHAVYDKVHLVPFGEYIPGDKIVTALQKLAPVGSCTPGKLKTLDFDGIPIGIAICFEDTDSAQMRRLAEMGARLLAFITNDSWFSYSDETVQHSWQSIARAVETGLPVVRVGNSGVTGVVSPDGRATWLEGRDGRPLVDRRGTMVERVAIPAASVSTPYTRLGDKPIMIAFAVLLLAMAVDFARMRRLYSED